MPFTIDSVDHIFLSVWIIDSIVNLCNHKRITADALLVETSENGPENLHTPHCQFFGVSFASKR